MITTLIIATTALALGFLIGEHRGIRMANAMLLENQRELFDLIRDEPPASKVDDARSLQPTMH